METAMTLLMYQVLKTVTEQGSFRKAAELLGLTPSAISHAVASLEGEPVSYTHLLAKIHVA